MKNELINNYICKKKYFMKLIKHYFVFLVLCSFFSCSSTDIDTLPDNNGYYFNLNYNNVPLVFINWKVKRDGDYFNIHAESFTSTSELSNDVNMLFHKDGTMIRTKMYDKTLQNYNITSFYFSKDTFTFNIDNIDEINKRIKVNFSGKLYQYGINNHTSFKIITGTIFLPYTEVGGTDTRFAKNHTSMLINNLTWRGMGQVFNEQLNNGSEIQIIGDSKYSINIVIPKPELISLGTFNFYQNSDIFKLNSVNLFRYYPGGINPNEFICTGSLTITEKSF